MQNLEDLNRFWANSFIRYNYGPVYCKQASLTILHLFGMTFIFIMSFFYFRTVWRILLITLHLKLKRHPDNQYVNALILCIFALSFYFHSISAVDLFRAIVVKISLTYHQFHHLQSYHALIVMLESYHQELMTRSLKIILFCFSVIFLLSSYLFL